MKQIRRAAALLTALALLGVLTVPAAAEAGTVRIATARDFADFARQCTRDVWSRGITVELTADVDLSGLDIAPVPVFQGTFHGNGHTISGFSFEKKGSCVGLFRTLTASAVVEDLTVEGTLAPQGSAGQAGLLAGENDGTVRRCTVRGLVTAREDVGGLVGLNGQGASVIGCTSEAEVTGVSHAGGIAGQNLGTVEGCTNAGSLNTQADQEVPSSVGGIAGLSRGTIRDCTNTGPVGYQHVGYNMGGIAGLQSGEITGCTNTGPVKGRKDVGGIVGQFEPYTSLTYGDSPSRQLSQSLSALFDQLGRFTQQLNGMAARGVEDAQAIQDSLSAIQDRTHSAGTEGREDFQAMADDLDGHITAVSGSLDALRQALDRFSGDAGEQLQEALDQSDALLDALEKLAGQTDSGLRQAIDALEDTVSGIRTQLAVIQTHRQAVLQELEALEQYAAEVARLIAAGEFRQALEVPLPSVDPAGHLEAITGAIQESVELAAKLPGQWSGLYDRISQSLGQTGRDISRSLEALRGALSALNRAGDRLSDDAGEALDAVSREADAIRALLKTYTDTLGSRAQSAVDDIDRELTAIGDRVNAMTRNAGADNDALYATSQAILADLEAVRQAISDLGREPELTVVDLTDEIDRGPGLIRDCTASGTVEGDSNVGGIAGTVSAELGDDPEATFDLGELELLGDVSATLRAVVRGCRFDGDVTAKNECGGGVAGRCEAGAILDCAARGTVDTGGDYCGGIAGRTRGRILRCAALVDLTGESWLGGAAGLGGEIADCRTMVRCDSDGEYLGAIAGQAEKEDLSGNRYLLEDLAGLDGVDYADLAQGLAFDEFSQLDHIPADFLTFSYRFVADGRTVAEIPFAYGDDLDLSQVPQAPRQDGQYGQWPAFPTRDLRRSMVLQAQFTAPASTLADRPGVAQLLVEGTFSPEAALTAEQAELPGGRVEGCVVRAAWRYAVTGSQSDTVTIRLRADGVENPAAAVYGDGGWERVESALDGSYLVFTAPAAGQVLLLDESTSVLWIVLPAALAVGVALGTGGFIWKRKHRPETAGSAEAQEMSR